MTPQSAPKLKKDRNLATEQDLTTALARLTSTDLVQLGKICDVYCPGSEWMSGRDLLGEVILRAYRAARGYEEHARPWPIQVPIKAYLCQAARSLAHGSRHSAERCDTLAVEAMVVEGTSAEWVLGKVGHFTQDHLLETLDQQAISARDAEEEARLGQIEVLFREDVEVQCLMDGIKQGLSASSIQDCCGWTETQYNSIRTRFRRTLKKLF